MTSSIDGRFCEPRVKVDNEELKETLSKIKLTNSLTWKDLAQLFNVSTYTLVSEWRTGKRTLPQSVYNKICQLNNQETFSKKELLPAYWGQKIKKENMRKLYLPNTKTAMFAEVYGALLGDGCITNNGNSMCITGNLHLDNMYIVKTLKTYFHKLFGIKPKIYLSPKRGAIDLYIHSRNVCKFLHDFGFPVGRKYGKIQIPQEFFDDNILLKSCIRGLFDTDGGVYPHPHTHIMAGITTIDKLLLQDITKALHQLKVPHGITKNNIQLYGSKNVGIFFSIIGSSNPRNMQKYTDFLATGRIQKTDRNAFKE